MSEKAKEIIKHIKKLPIEDIQLIHLQSKMLLENYVNNYYASVAIPKFMDNLSLWNNIIRIELNGKQIETVKFSNVDYSFYSKYREGKLFGFEVCHPNIMNQAAMIRCSPDSKKYMRYVLMCIFGKDSGMKDDMKEGYNTVLFGDDPTLYMKMPGSVPPVPIEDPLFFGKREQMYKQFIDYFINDKNSIENTKEDNLKQTPHFCSLSNVGGACQICKKKLGSQ